MSEQIINIPLGQLLPWHNGGKGQPRQHFDEAALRDLADSMMAGGFIGSIQVRPFPGRPGFYEILAGHRRTKAAALAHLAEIPATVNDLDDAAARFFVLQDNLQRQDFLLWEEGAGYAELVADGLTVAQVAGRVGKSPSYVSGRIAIHSFAGPTVRELYLGKRIGVGVVELACTLPDKILSPVHCPSCAVVCAEEATACPACGADLSEVFRFPSGSPQEAFAKVCAKKNATGPEADEILEKVKQTYGLSAKPVQTSLGLDDVQVSEAAIKVRTMLERKLADVGSLGEWFLKNMDCLAEFDAGQREAVVAQCEVAIGVFARIASAAIAFAP